MPEIDYRFEADPRKRRESRRREAAALNDEIWKIFANDAAKRCWPDAPLPNRVWEPLAKATASIINLMTGPSANATHKIIPPIVWEEIASMQLDLLAVASVSLPAIMTPTYTQSPYGNLPAAIVKDLVIVERLLSPLESGEAARMDRELGREPEYAYFLSFYLQALEPSKALYKAARDVQAAGIYAASQLGSTAAGEAKATTAEKPHLNGIEADLYQSLDEIGNYSTAPEIVKRATGKLPDGHTKSLLSQLVKRGIFTKKEGRGYGLPNWPESQD